MVLGFLVLKSAAPVRDADTFWHVASGRQIRQDWTLIGPDPLSPFTHDPWIRHAWLGDLAFGILDDVGGPRLLAVALPLMVALVVLVLYVVLRQTAGILLATLLLALAFLTMSGSISLRPQVISFAGTAAVAGLWLAWTRGGRYLWWVVPITWVWACCHGLWLLSPVIGAAVVAGTVLDRRSFAGTLRPVLIVAASALAGAVTPVGPGLLLAPLQVRPITQYIQEWQPDPWYSLPVLALWLLVALNVLGLADRASSPSDRPRRPAPARARAGPDGRAHRGPGRHPRCLHRRQRASARSCRPHPSPGTAATSGGRCCPSAWGSSRACALIWTMPQAVTGYPASGFAALSAAPPGTVVCTDTDAGSWLLWKHPGWCRASTVAPSCTRRPSSTPPWR